MFCFLDEGTAVDRLSSASNSREKNSTPTIFLSEKQKKLSLSDKKKALISVSDKTGIDDFAKVRRETA